MWSGFWVCQVALIPYCFLPLACGVIGRKGERAFFMTMAGVMGVALQAMAWWSLLRLG